MRRVSVVGSPTPFTLGGIELARSGGSMLIRFSAGSVCGPGSVIAVPHDPQNFCVTEFIASHDAHFTCAACAVRTAFALSTCVIASARAALNSSASEKRCPAPSRAP